MEYIMRSSRLFTALLLAGGVIASPAIAGYDHNAVNAAAPTNAAKNTLANAANNAAATANALSASAANANNSNNLASADALMASSEGIISQMQSDSNVANLMRRAKAVFIVSNSPIASTNISVSFRGGVMLIRNNGRWSDPVFFNVSSATAAQPMANNGPQALLIMSNQAMSNFRSGGSISLNGRRLHIINYSTSGNTQPASLRRSDLIEWSQAANNALPTNIRANTAYDQAVYGTNSQSRILAGRAPLTNQLAVNLARQMPTGAPPTQVGANQTGTRSG
jgi:hypothetical protein